MPWCIQLFGKVSARRGDHVEDRFATRKNAELLGYLAISPGSKFSRQHLRQILWPDARDVDAARVSLRQAISSIRRQLEPPGVESGSVLVTERDVVWLNRAEVDSDAAEFEVTLALVKGSPPDKVKKHFNRILELHQGEFMSGLTSEWVATEQEQYHEKFIRAVDCLIDLCFEEGDWQGAASALKRAVVIEPYDESRYCRLMTACRYLGRLTEALSAYEEIADRLKEELGDEPSSEISSLAASIRVEIDSGERHGAAVSHRPIPEERRERARRFPAPTTRFYGREGEMATLRAMIDDPEVRLITLEGPGGVGKTRLGLELAERLFYDLSGDLWFAPMADLTSNQEIYAAILAALAIEGQPGTKPVDMIVDQLSGVDRPVLVLDNFEHLIEEGAPLVRDLLDRLPRLCCLVTSRQALEIEGEHELRLGLLGVPELEATRPDELLACASVQLFLDRAKLTRPDFQITPGNAAAVADLCRQLEGIPLAIEICAAVSQTITPAQMVSGSNKRFELLVSRRRDIVPRHRTMRAAIEYSYRMLPADLAFIFRQLAIFQGGWSVESAQAVLGASNLQEAMRQLLLRSLLTSDEVSINGEATLRFRMLETFRAFGWEALSSGEQEKLANSHQAYFGEFAMDQRALYFDGKTNVDHLGFERANLTAAIRWRLADGRLADAMELCNDLFHFWMIKGRYTEGATWYRSLLDHPQVLEVPVEVRCKAARALMALVNHDSGIFEAVELSDLYLALAEETGDRSEIVHARSWQAISYEAMGNVDRAVQLSESALEEARSIDGSLVAGVLMNLASIRYGAGEYDRVILHCAEAYPLSKSAGYRMNACGALGGWASSLAMLGRLDEAQSKHEEALREAEGVGSPRAISSAQLAIAAVCIRQNRLGEAADQLGRALSLLGVTPDPRNVLFATQIASCLAAKNEQHEIAARLSAAVEGFGFGCGYRHDPLFSELVPDADLLRDRLGSAFEAAWIKGRSMNRREVLELALGSISAVLERIAEPV